MSTLGPSATNTDGEVVSALHLFLDRETGSSCLNPRLKYASIESDVAKIVREELADKGVRRPLLTQVRAQIIENEIGSWGTLDEPSRPLSPSLERELVEAYAGMALKPPRQRPGRRLAAQSVLKGVRLDDGCPKKLSAPAVRGDWAFVGHLTATAGHLYALRRSGSGWIVIAHRYTAIA